MKLATGGEATGRRSRLAGLRRVTRSSLRPAFGLAFITPLVFAGAVGATPRSPSMALPLRNAAVTPLAAVASTSGHSRGPAVIAVQRPPADVHVATTTGSAPVPAALVSAQGALGIPRMALSAYRNAEQKMAVAAPGCGITWNLLAGIGRIESGHANGGATDVRGTALRPIYGPTLDGSLAGNEVVVASAAPGRVVYARAMGPMQFLPGTWARYAADGDGDGKTDPQNLYDATLAAAGYLCSGGLNLRDQSQVLTAILRYNNSMAYAQNVLGWASAYATGVAPVDLPPIVGAPPPIADMRLEHLEHPEGLGPGSPLNAHGLSPSDPTSAAQLINLGQPVPDSQSGVPSWLPPWMAPAQPAQSVACAVICLEPQTGAPGPAAPPLPAAGVFPPAAEAPPAPMPAYAVPPAPMPAYAVPPAAEPPALPPPMPAYAVAPAGPQG